MVTAVSRKNGSAATLQWVKSSGKELGVKHIFRGHNQEADHLAKMGADGMKKITVEKDGNNERWKAVRGFWGGSNKRDGTSGCGIEIKGADRDKWITISMVAVPLGMRSALSAEVVGACILADVLGLIFTNVC